MKKNASSLPVPTKRRDLVAKPLDRWWFVTPEGLLIRGKTWTNYEPCFYGETPREYTMRLAPDDPAPLGRRILHKRDVFTADYRRHMAQWYLDTHPIGAWVTIDYTDRVRPYSDATALAIREERAA